MTGMVSLEITLKVHFHGSQTLASNRLNGLFVGLYTVYHSCVFVHSLAREVLMNLIVPINDIIFIYSPTLMTNFMPFWKFYCLFGVFLK